MLPLGEEEDQTDESAKQQAGEDMLEDSPGRGYTEDGHVTNTESHGSSVTAHRQENSRTLSNPLLTVSQHSA